MVRRITTMLLAALTFIGAVATTPTASAQDGPHLVSTERIDAQFLRIHVYSPAHNAVIPNDILVPEGNAPRPTLYLLPGYYGGTDGLTWANITDYRSFFRDKNVNVVSPIGGKGSLYSDWYQDDPILGRNKWTTYLTQELPSVIDREFNGTGRDAVAGLSMSGGPALDIAAHNPGRFKAAATYSGCPMSSGVVGSPLAAGLVLGTGGNIGNAWGPPWDPAWADHDPNAQPTRLRDVAVFVGSASGVPGEVDGNHYNVGLWGGPLVVEGAANACSEHFTNNARAAGVNVDRFYAPNGAHTWPLFEHQLRTSWRTIAPAIGA